MNKPKRIFMEDDKGDLYEFMTNSEGVDKCIFKNTCESRCGTEWCQSLQRLYWGKDRSKHCFSWRKVT